MRKECLLLLGRIKCRHAGFSVLVKTETHRVLLYIDDVISTELLAFGYACGGCEVIIFIIIVFLGTIFIERDGFPEQFEAFSRVALVFCLV